MMKDKEKQRKGKKRKETKSKQKQKEKTQNNKMTKASQQGHPRMALSHRVQLIGCFSIIALSRRQTANLLSVGCSWPQNVPINYHPYSMTPVTPFRRLRITRFEENVPHTPSQCQIR
jgi:hypothetical protein